MLRLQKKLMRLTTSRLEARGESATRLVADKQRVSQINVLKRIFKHISQEQAHEALEASHFDLPSAVKHCAAAEFMLRSTDTVRSLLTSSYTIRSTTEVCCANDRRKALLIGISYPGSPKELLGCASDIERFRDILTSAYEFDASPPNMQILSDTLATPFRKPTTKQGILSALRELAELARSGDKLVVHFSGHGERVQTSRNSLHEFQRVVVPADYENAGCISSEELTAQFLEKLPAGCEALVVTDCCYSEGMFALPYAYRNGKWQQTGKVNPRVQALVIHLASGASDENAADLLVSTWGAGGAVSLALSTYLKQHPHNITVGKVLAYCTQFLSNRGFRQSPCVLASTVFDVTRKKLPLH